MAQDGNTGGGLLDLERELTCSICTDILYQPLTLLDCLHTFCGSCLKEWFKWQAASAATNNRRTTHPYTCPSCRESVRGTKADWRLSTLLEGYLKANPDKSKTEEEKEEMRKHYKPGDDVLPPVRVEVESEDSEDERLMAEVRELSMADVDPETARRRAERAARHRQRRRQGRDTPEDQERNRQRQEDERQVEHQPSLRSLLSGSEINSQDVQEEILHSIYSEGLLNGIDIDNLTPAQEEELTERIAEAYRRRQRNRERSRNRDRSTTARNQNQQRADSQPPQQQQSRARPPISRPHLFEQQASVGAERNERRSASSTSHRRQTSYNRNTSTDNVAPAARSATDLSQHPTSDDSQRPRPRALSNNARSTTDPTNLRNDVQRVRNTSGSLRPDAANHSHRSRSRESEPARRQTNPPSTSTSLAPTSAPTSTPPQQSVRPAVSTAAFAPEPVTSETASRAPPSISCSRCEKPQIQTKLHYNCSKCNDGNFNLCLQCYRAGRGCNHWFGFGLMAMYRYEQAALPEGHSSRTYDYPHIITPRRYDQTSPHTLHSGAFCETCLTPTNDCYWYCELCLSGAWGYCNACVLQGRHCTHPLLPTAHVTTLPNPPKDIRYLPLPHLPPNSYVLLPVLTDCDICRLPIPPNSTRFHCYECSAGDYDVCNQCYTSLVSAGKISSANGPKGWRRCLANHRMAVVGYQDTPLAGGKLRITLRDPVGGWRLKDSPTTIAPPPPPSQQNGNASGNRTGYSAIASWSWFPEEGQADELVIPAGAEVRECEDLNEDWGVGVFAGRVGVWPRNHVQRL
ncbi:hypothetical protein M409DRAFT_71073 [Zasmidium cellare ATCC 36951]|uniref:RING-type domain-containing protein n=1 Tax=Zasmidium cellare ATCC 36951 TaxID=1080233 RepID=A0A6A6BZU2_ZASCE|nr:uncharacterized protein M409DRAFT_71073 [Zasmidium cellare ATCC 36951]KAF2159410.1 hypothetical protein M409DRAFT_71073 [Zasmidium cellare ATCC 36951]